MSKLDAVHDNKEILLAELVGWLHDYTKHSDEQLRSHAASASPEEKKLKPAKLVEDQLRLELASELLSGLQPLLEIVPWNRTDPSHYLRRCHKTAHFDKQETDDEGKRLKLTKQQSHPGMYISSPFGFEREVSEGLTAKLCSELPWSSFTSYAVENRDAVTRKLSKLFDAVFADTRRPINEISLWDWGVLVGALYKAAVAGKALGYSPASTDLQWRLLSLRVPGLDYITSVVRLPDLLGRRALLDEGFKRVRRLLEEEYPLGNEIYRDENGPVYVVPNISDLLCLTNSKSETLSKLIEGAFEGVLETDSQQRIQGDLRCTPKLETESWWGQHPDWMKEESTRQPVNDAHAPQQETAQQFLKDKLPAIGSLLSEPISKVSDPAAVGRAWNSQVADICTVCGLRPQGRGDRASTLKVCDICEERRVYRSKAWATELSDRTIWIDEVADTNGRVALLTGQFDLSGWLDGRLVHSLVLHPPDTKANVPGKTKAPSFSRIRRVWDTTSIFWKEVEAGLSPASSKDRSRLQLYVDEIKDVRPFHVYDLDLGSTTLSVVWYPRSNGQGGYFVSADNLVYVVRQLRSNINAPLGQNEAAAELKKHIEDSGGNGKLRNPDESASERQRTWPIRIQSVSHQSAAYSPSIPIFCEPRVFMALIPAQQSIDIVQSIQRKYEQEMGKVRNRLPLHLGLVYFQRRTPLRAALDAGKQMLDYRSPDSFNLWTVIEPKGTPRENSEEFKKTLTVVLAQGTRRVTWDVPNTMGDGKTPDSWYPYAFLEKSGDGKKLDVIDGLRPTGDGLTPCPLIHAKNLGVGDQIYFSPSTFDFEFLDTASRRFEISYDDNGRRPRATRPFLLDDIGRFSKLWDQMKSLERAQRHQVIYTIEATREAWYGAQSQQAAQDKVFRQFVGDTLAHANWPKDDRSWKRISLELRDSLIHAGVSGELADLGELHMEILKEK